MNPTETPLELPGLPCSASEGSERVKVAPTAARPVKTDSSHWYTKDGTPFYELAKKDGSGMRPVTLADARKLNLLPSVTTILKVLHKEALVNWLCEQTALAVLTTPRFEAESLDEFVYRCLHTEKQQDQEAQVARDRGTAIHEAMERLFEGNPITLEMGGWVVPAFTAVSGRGVFIEAEKILIGDGYAGKTDLIQSHNGVRWLWDYKSAKTLPTKGAWTEHRLQLSAYAAAYQKLDCEPIRTGNVYISTVQCGSYVICENPPWEPDYEAFKHLLAYWQWSTGYKPQ